MTIRIFDNDATENKILRTVDQVLMKSNNFWKLHLSFDITMYLKGTWIVTTVGKPQHLYDRLYESFNNVFRTSSALFLVRASGSQIGSFLKQIWSL